MFYLRGFIFSCVVIIYSGVLWDFMGFIGLIFQLFCLIRVFIMGHIVFIIVGLFLGMRFLIFRSITYRLPLGQSLVFLISSYFRYSFRHFFIRSFKKFPLVLFLFLSRTIFLASKSTKNRSLLGQSPAFLVSSYFHIILHHFFIQSFKQPLLYFSYSNTPPISFNPSSSNSYNRNLHVHFPSIKSHVIPTSKQ